MKRRILWALVACNVLLAVTLAMRFTRDNTAVAQLRRPSDYVLIPGSVNGAPSAVVYMIDTTNGWLGAMFYDDSSKQLSAMTPIDLARVFETNPTGGVGPGGPAKGPAANPRGAR